MPSPRHLFSASLRGRNAHGHVRRNIVLKFEGKMPNAPDTASIEHRALTPTARKPLSVDTLFGEKLKNIRDNLHVWGMAGTVNIFNLNPG